MAAIPKWQKAVAIPGMLLFGTCTVVVQKFLFQQKAVGLDKYGPEPHYFKKPWFQTNSMFIGMLLALVVYEVQRLCCKKKEVEENTLQSAADDSIASTKNDPGVSHKKLYFVVAAPACCDLLATALMNIGLLYIQASVWQMLRGSMVLFSSLFCAFILKRPHYPFMWFAVCFIIVALVIVGVAAVSSTGVGKAGVTTGQVIMAICLTVGSQLIQASQIVVEDFLMHDMTASPVLIVGLEGMWGTIITICIFLPIIQFTGGTKDEGNGVHEDTIDTFVMIGNSPTLIAFVILYVFFILLYNVTGMFVTNITSAVVRTILEGLRTLCVWFVQLIIFYSTGNPELGEEWTPFSLMQLSGFLLLFVGMLMYNKILKVPLFDYPDENKPVQSINDAPLLAKED
ncbi:putative integral membrane protein [Histomonas meleagridis]|uniref:putative integral membrane protein n=1 Tax=Histomonas meleagridis TaxID=135588 RepID=UPI00355A53F7|nr:putative integral membrane protein [Histomonas meleagridis]KAH0798115.1 putative integral membrane protein [Histomonas meleagridis]